MRASLVVILYTLVLVEFASQVLFSLFRFSQDLWIVLVVVRSKELAAAFRARGQKGDFPNVFQDDKFALRRHLHSVAQYSPLNSGTLVTESLRIGAGSAFPSLEHSVTERAFYSLDINSPYLGRFYDSLAFWAHGVQGCEDILHIDLLSGRHA